MGMQFFRVPVAPVVIAVCVFWSSSPLLAQDQTLSEGDRQALLEKLMEIKEGAGGRAKNRAGAALAAFREAATSDARAHALYLNCVEKVRFEDEKRTGQDFREWKRRHKEREDSPGFRRLLRHQLNWLLLTIEANSMEDGEQVTLSGRAISALEAILGDDSLKAAEVRVLSRDVTETVFALSYGIESEQKWPTSPVKLDEIYRNYILPPLASKNDVAGYRTAWGKWILQESKLVEIRSNGSEKGERSAAFERFLLEKRPRMLWQLEQQVFAIGDQKGAALAMLEHLEKYVGHKDEVRWTQEFLGLLEPQSEPEAE